MGLSKYFSLCGAALLALARLAGAQGFEAGPAYANFRLTLDPGWRTEILGPLFFDEQRDTQRQWGIPPLGLSSTVDPAVESEEFDFAYPLLTYDRYGEEYRWQFFQLWSLAGGKSQSGPEARRFTIFPFYFQQQSDEPGKSYFALLPFYGHLQNRLFRDKIDFVMLPFYVKSQKKDIVTWNMPYPFFHLRKGDGLHGWQVWPLVGSEHKVPTQATNDFGDVSTVGGHESFFVLWPFFTDSRLDLGTTNAAHEQGFIPFYSYYRSPLRDSTTWFWPLGVTHTIDREKKYDEWDAPWPLIEFAHGEGKTTHRVWPFYSRAKTQYLEDDWYGWPFYKYNRVTAAPLDRQRTRILFFLYSKVVENNTETGRARRRTDILPLYTSETGFDGRERTQILSPLEPFFPTSKSIERDYSPLFALWRSENNPRAGASSQSLLWNLWRHEARPGSKKTSLLFGLFQYQSTPEEARWRVFFLPAGHAKKSGAAPPPR